MDDYDHIKLITEQEPLQVKYEERPIYRNLIGKLVLNHETEEKASKNEVQEQLKSNSKNLLNDPILAPENLNIINGNLAKLNRFNQTNHVSKNKLFTQNNYHKQADLIVNDQKDFQNENQIYEINKDISRSFSLNDLINAANELINNNHQEAFNSMSKNNQNVIKVSNSLNKTKIINKSNPVLNRNDSIEGSNGQQRHNDTDDDDNGPKYSLNFKQAQQPFYLTTKNEKIQLLSNHSDAPLPPPPPPAPPLPSHLPTNSNQYQSSSPASSKQQAIILKTNSKSSTDLEKSNSNFNQSSPDSGKV